MASFLFLSATKKIASFFTINLTRTNSLILILIITTIIVFDSTLVHFSSYSGVDYPSTINIAIFVFFFIVFAIISILLLIYVRKHLYNYGHKPVQQGVRYFHWTICITLAFTIVIILTIILQMLFLNKYNLALLNVQTYTSHLVAMGFLSVLVYLFSSWLTSKRNYVVMLYTIAFSLAIANLVVSLIYYQNYFSFSVLPDVTSYPISAFVANLPGSSITESLSMIFDALSVSSFLLMWIATAILLSQYRYKMGKIKYFFFMSIPLIYYIFPFQNYFGDVFLPLLDSSPVTYSIIYILTFSATKQVGAVLFSLALWVASSLVYDKRIQKSLLVSSIGIVILFGTFEISSLQYHTFPPYGLVTEAFVPLGTYLLLMGIFTSANNISRDADLRRKFYKSAASQLNLLKAIGVAQMQKQLEKRVRYAERRSGVLEKETTLHNEEAIQLEEEANIKEILHDVLNELYYSKTKENPNP